MRRLGRGATAIRPASEASRRPLCAAAFSLVLLSCVLALAPLALAEVVQHAGIRLGFTAAMAPKRLPRHGMAPVAVSFDTTLTGIGGPPPMLRRLSLGINREGRLQSKGLPRCRAAQIQPTTTADALRACGPALVGSGHFSAQVGFTGEAPFPSNGKVLAFNGSEDGRPAILLHVYGTDPAPTSYTFPLLIGHARGTFGTTLNAELPETAGTSGYITGLSLRLERTYRFAGRRRSFLSAGCPAPKGFPSVVFPLARARLGFAGTTKISATLTGSCEAIG